MKFNRKLFPFLRPELLDEIETKAQIVEVAKGTEILRESQYIKVVPILIRGLIKVYSRFDDKELLLYYIEPAQSCVMTFYAALQNAPSKIHAMTEEDSEIALIPVDVLPTWMLHYPDFTNLYFDQFHLRYEELLSTIGHLLLNKMDKRLYDHLKKKSEVLHLPYVKMSHAQLAMELGTAREVVSRVLKKLELDGKVEQGAEGIKIIAPW